MCLFKSINSGGGMRRYDRSRDRQQWIYEYILKTSDRAIHFEMDEKFSSGKYRKKS